MLTSVGVPVTSEAEPSAPDSARPTLLCFSHLRWDFVFQRPQHLMSRFAREMTVVFWEEPMEIGARETAYLKVRQADDAANVRVDATVGEPALEPADSPAADVRRAAR